MNIIKRTALLLLATAFITACGGGIEAGLDSDGIGLGAGVDDVAEIGTTAGLGGLGIGFGIGN